MEGIFIPNPPQGDDLNEAVKEEEESKLVTTVEEIASAMLRLALEFGEKGFLQREFILYLRRLMREITGGEQPGMPQGAAAMPLSAQPEFQNVCPHPDHYLPPEYTGGAAAGGSPTYNRSSPNQPRSRRNIFSPMAEVNEVSPGGDYRGQMQSSGMQGSPRMQSPSRLGAVKKVVPATVQKMGMQMPIPATPMNVTFNLPQGGTTGRKYTYADLTPPSPGSQSYSDATNSGEWAPQPGAVIPCRMTPMNDSPYCQHSNPSPKQNLFAQAGGSSSPTNDSYYCQPLPQTPATSQRTATGRKSSSRRSRTGSTSRGCPSCSRG